MVYGILTNDNIKQENLLKSKQIKKAKFIQKFSINNLFFILFEIIFLLMPKIITSINYIKIKVNQIGYNQIFSDGYIGPLPSKIIFNELPLLMLNKIININDANKQIYLEWETPINDFSFMFSNLSSINSITMNFALQSNYKLSNMFYNCYNLEEFVYNKDNADSLDNIDMSKMFYNCSSLKSFNFQKLNLNNVNTSYMFYNCLNLNTFNFISYSFNVNDIKGMFYNCISLEQIQLDNIQTSDFIDVSYMFYNCSKLTSFISGNIRVNEMKYMFYNCSSLIELNMNYFIGSNNYINMTNLFYNCCKLEKIEGGFDNLLIYDTSKMFYNCISLTSLKFNPKKVQEINMTKMFYNCEKIENIALTIGENEIDLYNNDTNETIVYPIYSYFYTNDLSYAFYNCVSLFSLEFKYFRTDYAKEINYMMFNCTNLVDILIYESSFSNDLITNMRGVFQNCESLIRLDLTIFHTDNVEIMWDMFKNCKSLKYLNLQSFKTSKVTDMESMFEGCSSLTSLSLEHFETSNVHYMNKMFSGCTSLEELYFKYISSESLGTMHQMFYNCESLKYLNIFSLTEKVQSIYEMFEGTSENFTLCIKENEDIPNIFNEILKKENIKRDCSKDCYGEGYQRISIPEIKLCCPNVEYNGSCYDKCPPRTKVLDNFKKCENFSCSFYNYEQDDCIEEIPEGFYLNDTELHTINKCHENCKTCNKGPTETKANCLSCNENLKYQLLGNCFSSCEHGNYTDDSGILKCRCVTQECGDCSEESLEQNSCISCAEGYYTKEEEKINSTEFVKCYKDPPKYYLNEKLQNYHKCYSTCEQCYGPGNNQFHNCSICDSNHTFEIIKNESGYESKNCYEDCEYYYYFENDTYYCTETEQCPPNYNFIIAGSKQCVKSCNETQGYFKQFRNYCYKQCPLVISEEREDNPYLCRLICTYELPFELIQSQTCVASCSVMERSKKLCITNYFNNRTNLDIQEIIFKDISKDLTNSFNYSIITDNQTVVVEENETIYEIISSKNKNQKSKTSYIDFGKCESVLKNYYELDQNESFIILKMDTFIEGKTGPTSVYQLFYPLYDPEKLIKLDLTPCEGEKISLLYSMELTSPELYDKNNPIYNDICYPYSIKEGVDTTLGDMQKDYTNNNKSLCEENCEYNGYDEKNKLFKCDCQMKENLPKISDIKSDKEKLYFFDEINKIANFDVLRCTNLITNKDGLIKNIGFYSFMPTIVVYFVCVWLFYKKENKIIKGSINNLAVVKKIMYKMKLDRLKYLQELDQLNNQVNNHIVIIKQKISNESVFISYLKNKSDNKLNALKDDIIRKINNNKKKTVRYAKVSTKHLKLNKPIGDKFSNGHNINEDMDDNSNRTMISNLDNDDKKNDIVIIKKNAKNAPPIKSGNLSNKNIEKNNVNIFSKNNNNSNENKKENNGKNKNKDIKINEIMKYNDRELNDLNYRIALKYDKRTFCQFYFSLLRTDHLLMKVSNKRDYNSRAVKVYLCLYNFGLSFAVNALFFDDETVEQIFIDSGKFNILYQIPQIIYSSVISFFFCIIIDILALCEESILELKNEKVSKDTMNHAKKVFIILQIKFLYFFILSFIFLLMFWYYITCFCAVYKNTQYHLVKDTLIGFATSLLSPFITKLIPGIFRIHGIKRKNIILFKFSKVLEMIC